MNTTTITILFILTALVLFIIWRMQSKLYQKIDDMENGRKYYLTGKNTPFTVSKLKILKTGRTHVTVSPFWDDKLMFNYDDALRITKEVGLDVKELSTQKAVWKYDDHFKED